MALTGHSCQPVVVNGTKHENIYRDFKQYFPFVGLAELIVHFFRMKLKSSNQDLSTLPKIPYRNFLELGTKIVYSRKIKTFLCIFDDLRFSRCLSP